jgi:hypothetical protein
MPKMDETHISLIREAAMDLAASGDMSLAQSLMNLCHLASENLPTSQPALKGRPKGPRTKVRVGKIPRSLYKMTSKRYT